MKCPKCGNEQYCPCKNCKDTFSKGNQTYIRVGDSLIKCFFCGFIEHMDWWESQAYKQYKQELAKKEEAKYETNRH